MSEKSYAIVNSGVVKTCVLVEESLSTSIKESLDGDDLIEIPEEDLTFVKEGHLWDGQKFIAPQPFPSWIWDEVTRKWGAPVGKPELKNPEVVPVYEWDEPTLSWVEIPELGYLTKEGSYPWFHGYVCPT